MNAPRAIFAGKPKRRALPADWSAHHDNRLRDAQGCYGNIAKLSDEWGIATGALVARWHLLRAGEAPARVRRSAPVAVPVVEPLTFNNMRMLVTQRMRDILKWMEPGREVNSLELAAKVGMTSERLRQAIDRNVGRLAAAGWKVSKRHLGREGQMYKLEKMS